jgi:ABC-type xylose transport system permease subunit
MSYIAWACYTMEISMWSNVLVYGTVSTIYAAAVRIGDCCAVWLAFFSVPSFEVTWTDFQLLDGISYRNIFLKKKPKLI